MPTVRAAAPARVALAGNPSDGYGGRVLSLAIENFRAVVEVRDSDRLELLPAAQDHNRFGDVDELVADVRANGYYGGLRLLKATIKRFAEEVELGERHFTIGYETDIPRAVGLGGSSAIVIATIRALLELNGRELDPARLAEIALAVETDELGITAGLQDRVSQAHGGLTYMNFDPALPVAERYESLDPALLPPLFLAHLPTGGEPSELPHADLRRRWRSGEVAVVDGMAELGSLATRARKALIGGEPAEFAAALDASFDVRRRIATLDPAHVDLIDRARALGCAANFSGSGGAIVGTCRDGAHISEIERGLRAVGAEVAACAPAAQLVHN